LVGASRTAQTPAIQETAQLPAKLGSRHWRWLSSELTKSGDFFLDAQFLLLHIRDFKIVGSGAALGLLNGL
jgi:hypothetical protein